MLFPGFAWEISLRRLIKQSCGFIRISDMITARRRLGEMPERQTSRWCVRVNLSNSGQLKPGSLLWFFVLVCVQGVNEEVLLCLAGLQRSAQRQFIIKKENLCKQAKKKKNHRTESVRWGRGVGVLCLFSKIISNSKSTVQPISVTANKPQRA